MSEPISPELVLIDPELARAERARLLERDRLQGLAELAARSRLERESDSNGVHVRALEAQVITLRAQVRALEGEVHALEAQVSVREGHHPSGPLRRRIASVALPISLIANAILIAVAVANSRVDQANPPPPAAVDTTRHELGPIAALPSARHPSNSKARTRRAQKATHSHKRSVPTRRHRAAVSRPTVGAVERTVLAVAVQSPAGKLPTRLINRKTGLAKNGLQAICRRSTVRSFLCIVRPAQHGPSEGVAVRYRLTQNGRGVFTWYRYRNR